ncbi:MAG: hypothetical protein WC554_02985 [Clostridia bacterium]
MPKFEKKWQENKQNNKKRPYVFKVLHNMLKPEDKIKMMKVIEKIAEANRKVDKDAI